MKTGPDWNDLAYFSAIARTGGLMRAAEELGVSAATLSRRMKAFEAALGRRLFLHGADGYKLTSDGQALARQTRSMEDAARQIDIWQGQATGPVCVRISAGTWTAFDLAERLSDYWQANDAWVPEFMYCDLDLDIARREVDIGIRNRRPDQPWVARQQIGWVDYAIYSADKTVTGWIGPSWDAAITPSLRWIQQNHGDGIVTKVNSPHLACALARAGVGRVVLPVFVGDRMDGLTRLSEPIAELRSEQWLVSHHEGRNQPPIRAALDAISGYLRRRP
ncbi:LysR family transcriptional regulator [Roseobacter sinensis]|uniref:LysR family transcriptional regulator n=1 Tax=Roseobacter sinensis TaxID=2931391 RepID=A0ABT3BBL7_9RHOB|nr:LysR family transcriptional regulator [Roseobacter sp. WL0113]MCV3270804.1 LysR family transcriptional regulator [Roseobacter sp. WL0113]